MMKSLLLPIVFGLVALVMSTGVHAADTPDPIESVESATKDLLNKLDEVRPLYDSDKEKFFSEIESALGPFIDFDGFARGVMAKYYRLASDEQKAEFAQTFRQQLIRTYSSALVEFKNEKIEVLPLESPPENGRATARLEIHAEDGAVYPVTYTLALVDGNWKLRNIIVEGINIGLQFRSQFSNYMQQYRNDIDAVIENWDVEIENS